MNRQPDAEGKYPLSGREYYALRQLFGIASGFETTLGDLKDRAKLTPGTWRDMKMISAVSDKAITALVRSIPTRKLQQVLKELENTVVSVEVRGGCRAASIEAGAVLLRPGKVHRIAHTEHAGMAMLRLREVPQAGQEMPVQKSHRRRFPL